MPKRPRTMDADVDDYPAYKSRRIYDHVGEQLKRIRRKSEQDDRGKLINGNSPHSKNVSDYLEGSKRGKTTVAESFHDILEQIFNVKTKTMDQHANFFIQRECEMPDNDSDFSDAEGRYSKGINIKREPMSPIKKTKVVFGKGSSMYNPIVVFDGKSVDLDGDGVEVADTQDENIVIINLDDSTDNAASSALYHKESRNMQQDRENTRDRSEASISALAQSPQAPKQPILSVTVTGKARQVKTSLPLANGCTPESPNRLRGLGRTSLQDKSGSNTAKAQNYNKSDQLIVIIPNSNNAANDCYRYRQNDSSTNDHVSVGIELNRGIPQTYSDKMRRHSGSTRDREIEGRESDRKEISSCGIQKDVTNISLQSKPCERATQKLSSKENVTHVVETKNWKSQGSNSSKGINHANCTKENNEKHFSYTNNLAAKIKREDTGGGFPELPLPNTGNNSRTSSKRCRSRGRSRNRNNKRQRNRNNENFFRGNNVDDRTRSFHNQNSSYEPYEYRNYRYDGWDDWQWRGRAQHRPIPHWRDRFYTRHQIELSWFPIQCDVCHSHFRSRYDFLKHISKFAHCPFDDYGSSGKVAMYVCSYCPFETKFLYKIMQHYSHHHGSYFRYNGFHLVMMQALCRF